MIEKGVVLEPLPMALLVVAVATVTLTDWFYWLMVCVSGLVSAVTIWVRRSMRMAELRKKLAQMLEDERTRVNDESSIMLEHGSTLPGSPEGDMRRDPINSTDAVEISKLRASSSSPIPSPQNLRLLTYNIYLRPPLINSNGNDWKDERLDLFIQNVLPNYDLIALQEAFALGSSRQSRLIHAANRLGYGHVVKSVAPPFLTSLKFIDAGLLILSRYPIIEAAGHIYQTGHQIDHYAAKQAIYAKIKIPKSKLPSHSTLHPSNGNFETSTSSSNVKGENTSQRGSSKDGRSATCPAEDSVVINVFTTHTQASYYENPAHVNAQNDSARLSQVKELLAFVNAKVFSKPDNAYNPVLILGDLNLDARASPSDGFNKGHEYQWLQQLFKEHFGTCPLDEYEKTKLSTSLMFTSDRKGHVADINGLASDLKAQESRCAEFSVRDLILEKYRGEHPPTYGDAKFDKHGKLLHIQEPVLTNAADWACRLAIDFIFLITRSPIGSEAQDTTTKEQSTSKPPQLWVKDTNIQPFLVNPLQHPFFQLSDHYAVDTTLEIM